MNTEKLLNIITLPSMWLLYILFELFSGNLHNSKLLIFNLILLLPLAIIGFVFYKLNTTFSKGLSTKSIFITTFMFILMDQVIKLVIKLFFFTNNFYIIPQILSFNPIINTSGSWLNVRFSTDISFTLLIFINFIAIIIFIELYRFFNQSKIKEFYSDCCLIFIIAGSICSLIDKIFYGGSLDFIGIGYLFIADLKDIFINLSIFLFILSCYKNDFFKDDSTSTFKDDLKYIKSFISFIILDIKNLIFNK